jgi:hypothetical protein
MVAAKIEMNLRIEYSLWRARPHNLIYGDIRGGSYSGKSPSAGKYLNACIAPPATTETADRRSAMQ